MDLGTITVEMALLQGLQEWAGERESMQLGARGWLRLDSARPFHM